MTYPQKWNMSLNGSLIKKNKNLDKFYSLIIDICLVGSDGIEVQVPVVLSEEEKGKLQESAKILKETISTLDI